MLHTSLRKMKGIPITVLLLASMAISNALELAQPCNADACKTPDCKCSSTDSGSGLPLAEIPQMVMLTFDDAVTRQTYDFFVDALYGRKNPDGCSIGVTHFVTHEYTDYKLVNDLWLNGHEIALHSVTHMANQDHWKNMDLATMEAEFGDLRTILTQFAAVPESDIHGIRSPFLQTAGNTTMQGIQNLGLRYDSSLPTNHYFDPALWPYTFDYKTTQECHIPPCADASFPGIWQVPMTVWKDQQDIDCTMVDACIYIPETAEGILEWLIEQFDRHYKGSRAPFPVFMHAAWFLRNPVHFEAYKSFVEYLQTLPDVYIVNVNNAIEWTKNPKPVSSGKPFGECQTRDPESGCKALTCVVNAPGGGERWMTSCATECPKNYPWIGNPYGA